MPSRLISLTQWESNLTTVWHWHKIGTFKYGPLRLKSDVVRATIALMNKPENPSPRANPPVTPDVLEEVLRRRKTLDEDARHAVDAKKAIEDLIRRHTPTSS